MDIEALRQQYLQQLQTEEAAAPPPVTPEAVAQYVASDGRDDVKICQMIASLPLDRETFETSVRALLDIAADKSVGAVARLAALRQLGSAEFRAARFGPFHAEYIDLLRTLATDEDVEVRTAALERLTLTADPHALKLLSDGLQKVGDALVPAAKAVQLLARDDHGSALPIFRTLATEAKGQVREEALRALATDVKSAPLFERLAANKDEKTALRHIAAVNLKNISPPRFAKVARKLVLDENEDDKLRAAAVSAITHTPAVAEKVVTRRFATAVKKLRATTRSGALKSSIGRFSKVFGEG
ncbi:MAG: hypothetical protein JO013_14670 [Alphaproteobacteria bacterium]|nr:hypothetical protein [Alphaproteobacteria bacterium]